MRSYRVGSTGGGPGCTSDLLDLFETGRQVDSLSLTAALVLS